MKTNNVSYRSSTLLVVPMLLVSTLITPIQTTQTGVTSRQSSSVSGTGNQPSPRVLQSTEEQVILELTPPTPQFETTLLDDQPCQIMSIPGLTQLNTPGLPALPVQGVMLGIPQDAKPTILILEVESTSLPGKHPLCPSPQPDLKRSPRSPWQVIGYTYESTSTGQVDAFMPSEPAQIVSTGNLRSQRYAEVRFSPLQYNAITHELRYYQRIRLEVRFNAPWSDDAASHQEVVSESFFEDSLRSLLVNYEQARLWRSQPHRATQPEVTSPLSQPAYKILINRTGIYQVSYDDLQKADVPVDSLDPRTFQLSNQANDVAIFVQGEADGVFNSDDYLLFYGQKVDTKYTETNVYWLTWGGSNGLRMSSLNGIPSGLASVPDDFLTTQHAELDTDYFSDNSSGVAKDHWYWGIIDASLAPAFQDFTTDLYHLGSGSHTATVRGLIKGFAASPNHHTRIYLNGHLIDDYSFPTGTEYSFSANVPQSYLLEGANTLRVACPRDGSISMDAVLVNWFEIDYYHTYFAENNRLFFDGDQPGTWEFRVDGFGSTSLEVYDLTVPLSTTRITSATLQTTPNGQQLAYELAISGEHHFLAQTTDQRLSPLSISLDNPSNWKSTSNGADYIIVTHASFLDQVQPLADFRSSQGMRVQVIDVQNLYDEFNGGVFNPDAIKSFLAYAYANWVLPAPSFVLLVGDGTFDFKNAYGWNEPTYIPPYMADVDPWVGEAPTDNRYVSISGSDILPDLYIGRFPVRTPAEAQTMVEKTINYEQVAPIGGWSSYQTFIADDADSSGNFPAQSDQLINTYVPGAYTTNKIYYGINYTSPSSARAAIQSAFNQGNLIVHYIGHASVQQWADENLINLMDLPSFTNGNKIPFIVSMDCADGYFVWPNPPGYNYSALGESFVRIAGGGAIASWSPTGFGLSSGHELLDESLFSNLFILNNTQIGFLTTNAKYHLYATSSGFNDLIETYILFGDPALKLQVLPNTRQLYYLPLVSR